MREQLQLSLYGALLHRVAKHFDVDEPTLCARLRPHMYRIREAYRANAVQIAYDNDEVTAAYTLAYYPNYALLTYDALTNLRMQLPQSLSVVTFCGGPLPELLGISAVVAEHARVAVDLRNVDCFAEHWKWATGLSQSLVDRFVPNAAVGVRNTALDLARTWSDEEVALLEGAHVYSFQNCWNEMYSLTALKNVEAVARRAPEGSFFCFIDMERYALNQGAMRAVRDCLTRVGFAIVHDCELPWQFTPGTVAPARITDDFFDGRPQKSDDGKWRKGWHLGQNYSINSLIVRKFRC